MRLIKDDTILLVIDIQEKLFPHMTDHDLLEKNTGILIEGMKTMDIPILVTEQYTKGLGYTIQSINDILEHRPKTEKVAFSCCDSADFMKELNTSGKKNVLIAGIEAHVCVLQTAIDLIEAGFDVAIVSDCISSRKFTDKETALLRMQQEGALLTSYESVLFELCRYSGSQQFKSISKLVK